MKVKLTYPAPGLESKVGHIVDVTPEEGKRLLAKDWCIEVADEEIKEVKHGKKPVKELPNLR